MFFVSLSPSGGDIDEAGNAPGPERKIRSIVTWRVLFWRVCNLKRKEIGNLIERIVSIAGKGVGYREYFLDLIKLAY